MGGIAPVGLRLAGDQGANPGGIADQQPVALALDQGMKPLRVADALDPDRDGTRQRAVELLDGRALVGEPPFLQLAGFRVEDRHLLTPTVQITSHECHDPALLWWVVGGSTLAMSVAPQPPGRSHDIRGPPRAEPPEAHAKSVPVGKRTAPEVQEKVAP